MPRHGTIVPGPHHEASATEADERDMAINETTPLLNEGSARSTASQDPEAEVAPLAPSQSTSSPRLRLILGTAYVGVFLGAMDSSIVATLAGPIASEFHALSLLSWLVTAYLIANAACQPLSGRLTDIFGRGPGLVVSNLLFAAGNLVCGLARRAEVIILGRVVAGIGGGGLMSISTFLASDLVPLRKRGLVQGIGNIAYGSGAMLGGVFGGLVGWRVAFLVQVPVVLVSALLVVFLVKVPPKVSNRSLVSRIDLPGAILIVSFLVLLLLGLNAGGNIVAWTDPLVTVSVPLSSVSLVAFVWWEARQETRGVQPIIPVRLLLDRTVFFACTANLVATMAMTQTIFYVPLYIQVQGYSSTQAALRILPAPLGVAISSVGSGLVMRRTGRYVGLGVAVMTAFVAGAACTLGLAGESTRLSDGTPFVALFLLGLGYAGMLTVTLIACIAAVDHAHQAVITSATYAFRSVGATLGVTLASVVYQNLLRARLWLRFGQEPGAADKIARIREDLDELQRLPGGWREGVMASFAEAFRGVWVTGLALGVVALMCVSLLRQHTLHDNLARREE